MRNFKNCSINSNEIIPVKSFRDQTLQRRLGFQVEGKDSGTYYRSHPGGIGNTRARARERGKTRRRVCRHARPASPVSRVLFLLAISRSTSCRASWHPPTDDDRGGNSTWERGALGVQPDRVVPHRIYGILARRGANGGTILPPGGLRLARIAVVVVFVFLLLRSIGDVYILMPVKSWTKAKPGNFER